MLHPVLSASLRQLGLGLLSPSLLAVTFPRTLQSGGWGLLLCVPPRMMQSGVPGCLLSLDVPVRGAFRLLSLGVPVRGAAAPAASSARDVPVCGVRRRLSLNDPDRGAAAPTAFPAPDVSSPGRKYSLLRALLLLGFGCSFLFWLHLILKLPRMFEAKSRGVSRHLFLDDSVGGGGRLLLLVPNQDDPVRGARCPRRPQLGLCITATRRAPRLSCLSA